MKKNKLALFDLDETLLNGDTAGEWVKFIVKNNIVKEKEYLNKSAIYDNLYRKGQLDIIEYNKFLIQPLKGMSFDDLKSSIKSYAEDVVNRFSDRLTKKLLEKHTEDERVITSGSFSFLVRPMADFLGIEKIFGTDIELERGVFTGNVIGIPNFAEEKVKRIKNWIGTNSFEEVYAYSDSIYDLPLLSFADIPTAVNPDAKLRNEAKKRSWYIEDFRNFYS